MMYIPCITQTLYRKMYTYYSSCMMGHGNKAILGTVGHPHRREERIDVVDGEESLNNV